MNALKKISFLLLVIVTATLVAATIIEKYRGAQFVADNIYGSWWFVGLWALLTCISLTYLIRTHTHRRPIVFLIHLSFAVILLGAFITFSTAKRGVVHLRRGEPVKVFMNEEETVQPLPFELTLTDFTVVNYPGTPSPMDYSSRIAVADMQGTAEGEVQVSMNHIAQLHGYRFYQSGYDDDGEGTHLAVSHDPWGIGITYMGYAMLFISLIMSIFSKQTKIRSLYRRATRTLPLLILFLLPHGTHAESLPKVADKALADSIGQLYVLYNNRICPVNTLATDFVTKLSGKSSWNGLSANQVFTGWMFYFTEWENAKIIRIKDGYTRRLLGIEGQWASFSDFWNEYNEYKLTKPLQEEYTSSATSSHIKGLREADEKFNLVRMFYSGELLKIFPYPNSDGQLQWLAPASRNMPKDMPQGEWFFVRRALDIITEDMILGNTAEAQQFVAKIHQYQIKRAAAVLPSATHIKAETLYNTLAAIRFHVFLTLTLGLFFFFAYSISLVRHRQILPTIVPTGYNAILFIFLTLFLLLRWFVSGHIPLSNGFEIMQFMAWSVLLITFLLQRAFPLLLSFNTLLSGFILLVSMLGESNPRITSLMPVLHSPLLSLHVMIIMFSYALFAMLFFLSLTYIMVALRPQSDAKLQEESIVRLTSLSQLLLYPAEYCLIIGIFIGAIWANQSWGRYWGWDPKETWALITMLIYAVPLHSTSIAAFRSSRFYHIYMLLAFLSILMTYFGVNYFLGGMHSYA